MRLAISISVCVSIALQKDTHPQMAMSAQARGGAVYAEQKEAMTVLSPASADGQNATARAFQAIQSQAYNNYNPSNSSFQGPPQPMTGWHVPSMCTYTCSEHYFVLALAQPPTSTTTCSPTLRRSLASSTAPMTCSRRNSVSSSATIRTTRMATTRTHSRR